MRNMSGLDGAFLHLETPSTPMHVATLYLIDPLPAATGDFGSEIRRRLLPRLAPAPFFPSRLAPMPLHLANLVWIDGGIPDFSQHLRRIVLPSAAGFGELEACVSGCTRPCSIVDTRADHQGDGARSAAGSADAAAGSDRPALSGSDNARSSIGKGRLNR